MGAGVGAEAAVDELFGLLDDNGDGGISLQELRNALTSSMLTSSMLTSSTAADGRPPSATPAAASTDSWSAPR